MHSHRLPRNNIIQTFDTSVFAIFPLYREEEGEEEIDIHPTFAISNSYLIPQTPSLRKKWIFGSWEGMCSQHTGLTLHVRQSDFLDCIF